MRPKNLFQRWVREYEALSAYRLGAGNFLVVDRAALLALEVMAEMRRAPQTERASFIRNPHPRITEAVEIALRKEGRLDNLSAEAEEAVIETAARPVFVETREFSEGVTHVARYQKPELGACNIASSNSRAPSSA